MRLSSRSLLAGVSTLAIAAGLLTAGAVSASAAVTTPNYTDPNAYGTLSFYDASGVEKTSGNINDLPAFTYAVATADSDVPNPNMRAALYGYAIDPTQPVPALWSGMQISGSTVYPVAAAPGAVGAATTPTVTLTSDDYTLADLVSSYPSPGTGSAAGLYQLRMKIQSSINWQIATIKVTGSTWTQVFPAAVPATTLALTANSTSPQANGSSVTLTSAVTPSAAAGTVEFFDTVGAVVTSLGTATVASGQASKTVTPVSGSHSFTSVFTPTDPAAFKASTSSALPFTIQAPMPASTVSLSANETNPEAGAPVELTATTGPAGAVGSVEFFDSVSGSLGSVSTPNGSGQYVLTTSALASGSHDVTAKFTPSNEFGISTSAVVTVNVQALACPPGSTCSDDQAVQVTVDPGTIVIATPYTPANPFDLGSMALSSDGKVLSASKAFGDVTTPANGVTVTDTRAGDLPWTASVMSTDFTSGGNSINSQNLGLIGVQPVYVAGNALNATDKPVVTVDAPASATIQAAGAAGTDGLRGTAKQFASAAAGAGTVNVVGTLDLKAPTSTPAGLYKATVTFTVI